MKSFDYGIRRSADSQLSASVLCLIFLAALAVRGGWGLYRFGTSAEPYALEFPDEVDYWAIAESIARGDGLVGEHGFRALRMPLYPALLSAFASSPQGTLLAKVEQWPIGAFAAVLAALLGSMIAGRAVGILSGLLVALDPFLTFFSSLLLNESLFVTLLLGLWLAGWRILQATTSPPIRWWLLIGVIGAVCVYTKESSLGPVVVWTVFLLVRHARCRRAYVGAAMTALIIIVALLPWAVRNQRLTGDFCWLTHRGGISLYDGIGPQATGASNLGEIKQMAAVRGLDETEWDRYFREQSLQSINRDPLRVLRLAGAKIARTWSPLPNVETYQSTFVRLVSVAWTIPVYLFAITGLWKLRRRPWELVGLLLPALYILLLHAVFVGSVRYRLPAMPFLEILAAIALLGMRATRKGTLAPESQSPPSP